MTLNIPNMGKITASKSSLNYLATLFIMLEESSSDPDLKDLRKKQWNTIYDALDETGYFNKYKE